LKSVLLEYRYLYEMFLLVEIRAATENRKESRDDTPENVEQKNIKIIKNNQKQFEEKFASEYHISRKDEEELTSLFERTLDQFQWDDIESELKHDLESSSIDDADKKKVYEKLAKLYIDGEELTGGKDDHFNQLDGVRKALHITKDENLDKIRKKKQKKYDPKTKVKNKKTRTFGFSLAAPLLITLAIFFIYRNSILDENNFVDFETYIQESPRLVYAKIDFLKYLIYGRPPGVNDSFEQLEVYHVKGTANMYINLESVSIVETEPLTRSISLEVDRRSLYEIDLDISQADINLIESLESDPLPEATVEILSKTAGGAAGIAGGWIGSIAGSAAGTAIGTSVGGAGGGAIGKIAGGVLGGAGGAGGAYLATSKFVRGFLSDYDAVDSTFGQREEILEQGRELIAADLLFEQLPVSRSNDAESAVDYFSEQAKVKLKELFTALGWKQVSVDLR